MKRIQYKMVWVGFLCLALFSICLIVGFFEYVFFIPAVAGLVGYIVVDRKWLRCPNCSGFTNLDRLFYARKHIYHCQHCGEIIKID